MERFSIERVGGLCAILYAALIVVFLILIAGTTDLLDAEGAEEILPILDEDKGISLIAGILFVIMPLLLAVSGMAFFRILQEAGTVTWIALFGFVGGGLAILYRGFTWIAMTLELAPAYAEASGDEKTTYVVIGDTLEAFAAGADVAGGVLIGGVGLLIFSVAMLKTKIGAPWIAWVGIFASFFTGFLTLLSPVSEIIELITLVGFIGFIIWMVAFGIIAWRTPTASVESPS